MLTVSQASTHAYLFPGISHLARLDETLLQRFASWYDTRKMLLSEYFHSDLLACLQQQQFDLLSDSENQLLGYCMSCANHDWYRQQGVPADYLAGYSMGIFATLYGAGSLSLASGAWLLSQLNQLVVDFCIRNPNFQMAAVIGFSREEALTLLEPYHDVEIANQNAANSVVISGSKASIQALAQIFSDAGALLFKTLPIARPYHSSLLHGCVPQWEKLLRQVEVRTPRIQVMSSTTTRILHSATDCLEELRINFCTPFSWFAALQKLQKLGITQVYECGPGRDLYKIGKYSGVAFNYVKPH